jgi:hypothetical protein
MRLTSRSTFAMLTLSLSPIEDRACCCQYNHNRYVASEEAQVEPTITDTAAVVRNRGVVGAGQGVTA